MARDTGAARRMTTDSARRAFSFRMVGDVASELRRVTWPSREETMRLTLMVLMISAAIGVFLGLVDMGFARFFDVLHNR